MGLIAFVKRFRLHSCSGGLKKFTCPSNSEGRYSWLHSIEIMLLKHCLNIMEMFRIVFIRGNQNGNSAKNDQTKKVALRQPSEGLISRSKSKPMQVFLGRCGVAQDLTSDSLWFAWETEKELIASYASLQVRCCKLLQSHGECSLNQPSDDNLRSTYGDKRR